MTFLSLRSASAYGRTAPGFSFPARVERGRAAPRPLAAPAPSIAGDRRLLGILAILGSTIAFPLSDLAAQSLCAALPPVEVAWLRYVVFFLVALPLFARRGAFRAARPGLQAMRGLGSLVSTLGAIMSFSLLAVPTTTAIGFVAPVMVTALAAVLLKEKVGPRRWAAALVALAGVMVIVRPGGESFRLAALIPLLGAAANAVTVVCTRLNTRDEAGTTVLYTTAIGTLVLTGLVAFDFHMPTPAQFGVAAIVGLFGTLGSLLQVYAYRKAPVSLLAPFTYAQLIFASGMSFILLGTAPGMAMAVGASMIAASAIYTAYRERVRGVA